MNSENLHVLVNFGRTRCRQSATTRSVNHKIYIYSQKYDQQSKKLLRTIYKIYTTGINY
jgi:hypothetical protein